MQYFYTYNFVLILQIDMSISWRKSFHENGKERINDKSVSLYRFPWSNGILIFHIQVQEEYGTQTRSSMCIRLSTHQPGRLFQPKCFDLC